MLFHNLEIVFQLFFAGFLGGLVGIEREYKGKEAGFRTYTLVSLGAALFTIISVESVIPFFGTTGLIVDPSRIVGQIVLGIGFLGAGLIVYRQSHVEGLTTAAGLWVAAAIGTATGFHLYFTAIFVSFFTLLILAGLGIVEEKIFGKGIKKEGLEK
jgi:putative Mg2+ transporter-C (MgtC) family protein